MLYWDNHTDGDVQWHSHKNLRAFFKLLIKISSKISRNAGAFYCFKMFIVTPAEWEKNHPIICLIQEKWCGSYPACPRTPACAGCRRWTRRPSFWHRFLTFPRIPDSTDITKHFFHTSRVVWIAVTSRIYVTKFNLHVTNVTVGVICHFYHLSIFQF